MHNASEIVGFGIDSITGTCVLLCSPSSLVSLDTTTMAFGREPYEAKRGLGDQPERI